MSSDHEQKLFIHAHSIRTISLPTRLVVYKKHAEMYKEKKSDNCPTYLFVKVRLLYFIRHEENYSLALNASMNFRVGKDLSVAHKEPSLLSPKLFPAAAAISCFVITSKHALSH